MSNKHKTCSKCKKSLELNTNNFSKASNTKDGFYTICKKCRNKIGLSRNEKMKLKRIEHLQKINNNGFKTDNIPDIISGKDKFEFICFKGHTVEMEFFSAVNSKGCPRCKALIPYHKIATILQKEDYTVITKGEDFKGAAFTKIEYICPKGHRSSSKCSSIRKGHRCVHCSYDIISSIHRKDIKEVIELVEDSGYHFERIIGVYRNSRNRMILRCPKGHTYETSILNFTIGSRCNVCSFDNIRGENHYLWSNGKSSLNNYLRSVILRWKIDSFKASNYICFITNMKSSGNLVVHHHKNFSDIVDETLLELNVETLPNIGMYDTDTLNKISSLCLEKHYKYGLGVVMLEDIHRKFHSIYGVRNNTIDQVMEFKNDFKNSMYPEFKKYNSDYPEAVYYI